MKKPPRELDAYYTPAAIARKLISYLPADVSGAVLDPTVGDGALLNAVHHRYKGHVPLLGMDINENALRTLRRERPSWCLSKANSLNGQSRRASAAWQKARLELDAVVMNPPFSHKGGGGAWVEFGSFAGYVAPAIHFLIEMISNLNPKHGFYTILPDGALRAEKHEHVWHEIEKIFEVSVLAKLRTSLFSGARVSTSIVHLKVGQTIRGETALFQSGNSNSCRCVEIIRGRVPVYKARLDEIRDPAPFVHTSPIGSTHYPQFSDMSLSDSTPFVLISRVGSWREPRTFEIGHIVLSDCVIAIRPMHRHNLGGIRDSISEHEESFHDAMRGTGAQYLTIRALTQCLKQLGWHPQVSRSGAAPGRCLCESESRMIIGP